MKSLHATLIRRTRRARKRDRPQLVAALRTRLPLASGSTHVVSNYSLVVKTERTRMAEQSQGVRRSEKVRGKDIEGKIRVLDKTYPQQLTLF